MKRAWIYILAAALILAVVLLSLLVFFRLSPSDAVDSGDTDSLYPYAFRQTGQGLRLTISGPFPKDCRWTAESRSPGIAGVSELRQSSRSAKFLIRPAAWGNAGVVFSLEQDTPSGTERIYALEVDVNVNTAQEINILHSGHTETTCIVGGGAQYAYRIVPNPDGTLELYADNDGLCRWRLRVLGACVAAESAAIPPADSAAESDTVQYHIRPIRPGTDTLQLCSEALGETLVITVESAPDGTLTVSEHQVADAPVESPSEFAEQAAAYRRLLGEPVLPEEARLTYANAVLWPARTDGEAYLNVGFLEFELNGKTWMLYASDEATAQDFYGDLAAEAGAPETIELDGKTAAIYDHPDGAFAGWQSDAGRSWYLRCDGAGTMAVTAAVQKLLKAVA